MRIIKWIFRVIWAGIFGTVCGVGAYFISALFLGILQLLCGWSRESTETLIMVVTVGFGLFCAGIIIHNGMTDDANKRFLNSYVKTYEELSGEKYTCVPPLESIGREEPTKSKNVRYVNSDIYGMPTGITKKQGNTQGHYSFSGDYSLSNRYGEDILHYNAEGYRGRSHINRDGTVTHYDKNHMHSGSSKVNKDGSADHYDEWGIYQGSSKKE